MTADIPASTEHPGSPSSPQLPHKPDVPRKWDQRDQRAARGSLASEPDLDAGRNYSSSDATIYYGL
jgi:hypothetical protein